jgi:MOSC domain-containing protein YiiM
MAKLIGIATHQASKGTIKTHLKIEVSTEAGLKNDFQGQKGPQTQVTLLSQKSWEQACSEVGATLAWTERRANLLIDDIEFNDTMVGQQIQMGGILLEITRETDPCQRMDDLHIGLKTALKPEWRGGARCKVLRQGMIQIGDSAHLLKRV